MMYHVKCDLRWECVGCKDSGVLFDVCFISDALIDELKTVAEIYFKSVESYQAHMHVGPIGHEMFVSSVQIKEVIALERTPVILRRARHYNQFIAGGYSWEGGDELRVTNFQHGS